MSLFHWILGTFCLSMLSLGITTALHAGTALPTVMLPAVPQDATTQSPAAQPAPATKQPISVTAQTEESEKKDIYLNFENTDLSNFIDYIAELRKINILPDKSIEGSKVSLTIREPLSNTGAWNVFITVLEMSGFSIIKAGLVYKVVPKDKKIQQPLPAFINTPHDKLPNNDLTIRYVFFLSNIPTADIQPLLESMLSQPNAIYENKEMNAFVITDKSLNVRSAVKLLQELDSMGMPESVAVMRLKQINAADAKGLLDALIRKPETNPLARLLGKNTEGSTEYFSPTTRVIVEERSNSLILLGTKTSMDKVIEFVSNHIDTELKAAKSPLHVYELQHIDASQIKEILSTVTAMPESSSGQVAGKYGSIRGGVKYFKSMSFNVDKDGNRLIANCPDEQDWELVKRTIIDLDKPQPQVAIESMIVSINATDADRLAGNIRNKYHGQIGKNIDFQSAAFSENPTATELAGGNPISLLGNLIGQVIAQRGATILTFGKKKVWAALQTLKTQENGSVLSQPFITIANKTQGTITVGTTMRVPYEDQGTANSAVQSWKPVDANTTVKITPQINLDGIIRMEIDISIKDFTDNSGNNTSTHALTSKVTIADGQVLALGGFIKTSVGETIKETPLLGKIPILGWFFKNKNRSINKQYIFIFLAPTIVKPRDLPGMNLYTKMKLHDATQSIEDAVETKRTIDPIHNWFFNSAKENYSHKVIDFANARYQPTTVDIKNDSYYRSALDEDAPRFDAMGQQQKSINEADLTKNAISLEPPILETPLAQTETPTTGTSKQTFTPEPAPNIAPPPVIAIPPTPRAEAQPLLPAPPAEQTPATPTPPATSLEQQRQEMRRLFAAPATDPPQQNNSPLEPVIMLPQQELTADLVIDPGKRNSLKEFLAASPAVVQNNNNLPSILQGG